MMVQRSKVNKSTKLSPPTRSPAIFNAFTPREREGGDDGRGGGSEIARNLIQILEEQNVTR